MINEKEQSGGERRVKWKGWGHVWLDPETGAVRLHGSPAPLVDAIAPVIVSASRSTDIPALYGDWFIERLKRGYVTWKSPFDGRIVPISFINTRVFVFWSKNPRPFFSSLADLTRDGQQCLFLFTLNDYTREDLEPGIPSLEERIRTFSELSSLIGQGRLTWRFDPLLLSDSVTIDELLERIGSIGDQIARFTERLVISFIDIARYPRVQRNLAKCEHSGIREFSAVEMRQFASGLSQLNEDWGLEILACGEGSDLTEFGIAHGACISFDQLAREFSSDQYLMDFLLPPRESASRERRKRELKDPGQRGRCRCVVSKDIGCYSTCIHGCRYCYATSSSSRAEKNYRNYCEEKGRGIIHPGIIG